MTWSGICNDSFGLVQQGLVIQRTTLTVVENRDDIKNMHKQKICGHMNGSTHTLGGGVYP